jgi:hypothetical protein
VLTLEGALGGLASGELDVGRRAVPGGPKRTIALGGETESRAAGQAARPLPDLQDRGQIARLVGTDRHRHRTDEP